ncbi:short-chain dehydrogenase/reductase 3-like isoform X2 [Mercenaria mercenaria]|uniref:short-chain dehydrogenase/reductase 3-like isoform X2 n=1 Tax=Mercenaria mercenaria TaxID=6596 RepID=UPI00234EE45E|nr:short-chain dehydrogenase/reductase 3-like isoform X2 [Mercenaria mercenaria]
MRNIFYASVTVLKLIGIVITESVRAISSIAVTKTKDISDEIILITGGGRGIGRQIALEFAKFRPKCIIIWGRKKDWLKRTVHDIQSLGVKSVYFVCDVSKRELIYEKAQEVQEMVGDVTLLVNNAGILSGKPIEFLQPEDMKETLKVNTLAQIWTIKAFLPAMLEKGKGHIVCMSSLLGLLGLKGVCDYATSKFATTGLMECLMQELEDYPNIHTTIIHPYQIDNNMFAGMQVRFPSLFPPLKEEYVTEATVQAVLNNRKQITLPVYFYLILFFRRWYRIALVDIIECREVILK